MKMHVLNGRRIIDTPAPVSTSIGISFPSILTDTAIGPGEACFSWSTVYKLNSSSDSPEILLSVLLRSVV